MTTITLDPIVQERPAFARLSAKPIHGSFADLIAFEFYFGTTPVVDLEAPAVNDAWVLALTIGSVTTTRTVTFTGNSVHWDALTDVDPSTLQPVPVNAALTAWQAVRDEIMSALDVPDLITPFENRIA